MPDRLSIYNGALRKLGESRKLSGLAENRPPRFALDEVWDDKFLRRVLQMGQWNFATRTALLVGNLSTGSSFNGQYAFEKPADFVRTTGVYQDENLTSPLTQYRDEANFLYAYVDTLYFSYVSDDVQYGADLSLWPPNFTNFAQAYMAHEAAPKIAGLEFESTTLEGRYERALKKAKNTDAAEDPTRFSPRGSWVRARQGSYTGDRGSRNRLIG